jgi:hypothetical protein
MLALSAAGRHPNTPQPSFLPAQRRTLSRLHKHEPRRACGRTPAQDRVEQRRVLCWALEHCEDASCGPVEGGGSAVPITHRPDVQSLK